MYILNTINNQFSCLPPFLPKDSTKKPQEIEAFLPSANISIANEKLLSDRNATAIEVTTFLRQQAQSKLRPILGANNLQVLNNLQQTDDLPAEVKSCKLLQEAMKNSFKDFKQAAPSQMYEEFSENQDKLEEIWETNKIDELISSQKTTLTDEEKYRIIKIKDYFLGLSDDFNKLFQIIKNIFNNTGLSNNMNDFELLSFCMYWSQQLARNPFKNQIFVKYNINILLIAMLQSLNIDPHIIFILNKQQASKFKQSCYLLNDLLARDLIINITKEDNDLLCQQTILLLNSFYTLWVGVFSSDITENLEFIKASTVCREKEQFCLIFVKYIADTIQDKIKPAEQKESSCVNQQNFIQDKFYISKEKLYIGDEIEFCYHHSDEMSKKEYSAMASQWIQKLEEILQKDNITDYNIESIQYDNCIKYKITIGNWNYCLFFDSDAPEVTTQPYRVEDKFCIKQNGHNRFHDITAVYNKFIFTISKHLNLKARGCHKHFDVRAFEGNTELLIRLLLMVQNHPELPRFFNRLESIEWYPYLTTKSILKEDAIQELSKEIFKKAIYCLNKGLESGDFQSKFGDNKSIVTLAILFSSFTCSAIAEKFSPIAYHHIENLTDATLDIMKKPVSTAEIRYLNAQNGSHIHLLNIFFILIFDKLIEDQNNKKPFEFVAIKDPEDFTIEESRNLTENFLTELNMSEEYKARFRELSESLHQGHIQDIKRKTL